MYDEEYELSKDKVLKEAHKQLRKFNGQYKIVSYEFENGNGDCNVYVKVMLPRDASEELKNWKDWI